MKFIKIALFLLMSIQVVYSQEYADKIEAVLDSNEAEMRGKLSNEGDLYSLFYFDTFEKDSHAKALQEKGYHGGGPTWLALLYTALNIFEENIIDSTKYEISASGITFKSEHKDDLLMIAKIIALVKTDETVMTAVIEEAKKLEIMK